MDRKAASENQNLQRMNADERRLEKRSEAVGWRPSAEMFRMDTREGMEAYEASFRMKIAQPRAALPHEHGAQVHANL